MSFSRIKNSKGKQENEYVGMCGEEGSGGQFLWDAVESLNSHNEMSFRESKYINLSDV